MGGGDGVPAVDARREKYRIGPFPLTVQLKEGMQQVEKLILLFHRHRELDAHIRAKDCPRDAPQVAQSLPVDLSR